MTPTAQHSVSALIHPSPGTGLRPAGNLGRLTPPVGRKTRPDAGGGATADLSLSGRVQRSGGIEALGTFATSSTLSPLRVSQSASQPTIHNLPKGMRSSSHLAF